MLFTMDWPLGLCYNTTMLKPYDIAPAGFKGMYFDEREVIHDAVTIALVNNWQPRAWNGGSQEVIAAFDVYKYGMRKVTFFNDDGVRFKIPVFEIIFSHEFAKAFWGDGRQRKRYELNRTVDYDVMEGSCEYFCKPWEYHLQQLAIAESPINYLGVYIYKLQRGIE